MKYSEKPVRQCRKCLLNMGDRCWRFTCPRREWKNREKCVGFDNDELNALYETWVEAPYVPDGRTIRRNRFGKRGISRRSPDRKRRGRIRWIR